MELAHPFSKTELLILTITNMATNIPLLLVYKYKPRRLLILNNGTLFSYPYRIIGNCNTSKSTYNTRFMNSSTVATAELWRREDVAFM